MVVSAACLNETAAPSAKPAPQSASQPLRGDGRDQARAISERASTEQATMNVSHAAGYPPSVLRQHIAPPNATEVANAPKEPAAGRTSR